MPRISRLAVVVAVMFAASDLLAQSAPSGSISNAALTGLNPGDQIRIAVWRNPEFSGDFLVAPNGTVSHPLYREIQVTGVPLNTVEDRLRAFLTRFITSPQFVIQPLVKIIVAGEVRTPNVYAVPPETTIAQAIALAGGPTERGNLQKLRIIRDNQQILVDLTRADSDVARLQIRSGDQMLLPRRGTPAIQIISPAFSAIAAAAALVSIFSK